jgi:hypothetical protein
MKKFIYESFGDTIEFAESLGWVDKDDAWNDTMIEANDVRVFEIEQDAIDYIESQGYEVIMDDD